MPSGQENTPWVYSDPYSTVTYNISDSQPETNSEVSNSIHWYGSLTIPHLTHTIANHRLVPKLGKHSVKCLAHSEWFAIHTHKPQFMESSQLPTQTAELQIINTFSSHIWWSLILESFDPQPLTLNIDLDWHLTVHCSQKDSLAKVITSPNLSGEHFPSLSYKASLLSTIVLLSL